MIVPMQHLYPGQAKEIGSFFKTFVGSGVYIGGPFVAAFEQEWAHYCGAKYCVGTASGFSALQLIVMATQAKTCSYTPLTCLPTPLAIKAGGAEPVPYAEPGVPASCDTHVKVHLYGEIGTLEKSSCTILIEDAAQAHGYHYRYLGCAAISDAAAWSFYPTKNLGALGDAGAVTTNDEGLAREVRALCDYKSERGINARLDPLQAGILSIKLRTLDANNCMRAARAETYTNHLKGLPGVTLPSPQYTNWHQYVIRLKDREQRDALKAELATRKVETQIHYPEPACVAPYCAGPWAQQHCDTVLSLPVGPHLTHRQIWYVIDCIKEILL